MSESESSEAAETGKAVQPAKREAETTPPARGGRASALIATLALLIALAAAGAVGYDYWQRQQQEATQPWLADIQSLKTRLAALEDAKTAQAVALDKQRASLEESLQRHQVNAQSSLEEQRQSLASAQARLQRLDEKLQHLASVSREDWLLAEAEYLLRLARHRLALGDEIEAAAKLLRAAQSSLRAVGDPDIEPVRAAVAADLVALEEAGRFDLEGLYAEVGQVALQATALTPLSARTVEASPENVQEGDEQPPPLTLDTLWPAIKHALASTAEKLQAYIRVSHRDSEYQRTVIAGGQAALFSQNLQLLFEQAQWALLAGNTELYRDALARSGDWLRRYYALGESEQALLDRLEALQQRRVRAPKPPLDASLEAIMLYIDGRQIPGNQGQGASS